MFFACIYTINNNRPTLWLVSRLVRRRCRRLYIDLLAFPLESYGFGVGNVVNFDEMLRF